MKKLKWFCCLFSICLLLLCAKNESFATSSQEVYCTTQSEIENALTNASTDSENPTVVVLKNSIDISGQLVIKKGTFVQMCSDGNANYTLTEQTKFSNKELTGVLYVQGSLTLSQITIDANYMGRAAIVANEATLTLDNGASFIKGMETGYRNANGLGVYIKNGTKTSYGTFIMKEGSRISQCKTQGKGAQRNLGIGLYVGTYGQVEMSGGEITQNVDIGNSTATSSCALGGGVYIENYVNFTMTGGKISNNRAYSGGGGIYIAGSNNSSVVTLSGSAEISENLSTMPEIYSNYEASAGGGIYLENGTLTIKDNAVISGNISQTNALTNYSGCGGGIFIGSGHVVMEGGSIFNNATESIYEVESDSIEDRHALNGGGVYVESGSFTMSGGSIYNNTAHKLYPESEYSGNGGGICLGFEASSSGASEGSVILHGGVIEDNLAESKGNGIYVTSLIPIVVNNLREDETKMDVTGNPVVQLGQNPVVWNNQGSNIYLSGTDSILAIDSTLQNDAKIGITAQEKESVEDILIAKPVGNYAIRNADTSVFIYDDTEKNLNFLLNDDGFLILSSQVVQNKVDLSSAQVEVGSVTYNGLEQTPEVIVTYKGTQLSKETDYTVTYRNNTNVGNATVVINGKGNYTGTVEQTFEITPCSMEKVTVDEITDKYDTGKPLMPTVRVSLGDITLNMDEDYTVAYGENSITITGLGNYTGIKTVYFTIKKDDTLTAVFNEEEFIKALQESKKILLGSNILLTQEIRLNTDVTIIGNGFTISMEEDNRVDDEHLDRAMFVVLENAKLTLSDVQLNGNNKTRLIYVYPNSEVTIDANVTLTKGMASASSDTRFVGQSIYNKGQVSFAGVLEKSYSGYYGVIYNSGSFVMKSGSCIQNVKTSMGGAIYNTKDGIFSIKESKILYASGLRGYGAAISNFGTMDIESSLIKGSDCSVSTVYNEGTLTMKECQVTENRNSSVLQVGQSGGTLYQKSGTFEIIDSQIVNNIASTGGGVFVDGGTFMMNGEASKISENAATYTIISGTNVENFGNGGGVFINNGIFEMNAGSICNNKAGYEAEVGKTVGFSGNGGGVFINGGTFTMNAGTISGNEAVDENTAGVYYAHAVLGTSVKQGSVFQMSGSAQIDDVIYVSNQYTIEILDEISDSVSYKIVQENTNAAAPVAVYRSLDSGESEFVKESDAFKFTSQNTTKAYEVLNRQIVLERQDLAKCSVTLAQTEYAYTGKNITPDLEIKDSSGNLIREYDIEGTNIKVGSATVTLKGDGYTTVGSVSVNYQIVPRSLSAKGMTVTLEKTSYSYSSLAITPTVTVKNGNTVLTSDDYTVTYENNIKAGTATVIVTGKGNYTDSVTKTFTIKKKQTITGNSYNKTYSTSTFVLNAKTDGDGKLTYSSDNTKVATVSSTGKVTLKGIGTAKITVKAASTDTCFAASKTISVTVTKATQTITATTVYNKTYGNKTFFLNAKTSGNGTLSYKSADTKIVKVSSSGKVTIVGCGRTTITVTAKATTLYKKASTTITITVVPKKATISSVKNQTGKKMAITWKKDTTVSGYQIQYATDKSFKKNLKTITTSNNSKTVGGLKKGTTYYVKIRSYKLVNGRALFGEWSDINTVKITK